MAMELMQQSNGQDANETRDTLFLLGGAALVVFGAGLILSTPAIRRYLGEMNFASLVGRAFPDVARYMKIRAM